MCEHGRMGRMLLKCFSPRSLDCNVAKMDASVLFPDDADRVFCLFFDFSSVSSVKMRLWWYYCCCCCRALLLYALLKTPPTALFYSCVGCCKPLRLSNCCISITHYYCFLHRSIRNPIRRAEVFITHTQVCVSVMLRYAPCPHLERWAVLVGILSNGGLSAVLYYSKVVRRLFFFIRSSVFLGLWT